MQDVKHSMTKVFQGCWEQQNNNDFHRNK